MINKKMFQKLRQAYAVHYSSRGLIIRRSNIALHKAKQAIFSLHRDQVGEAETILAETEKILSGLKTVLRKAPDLKYTGVYKAALEEYVEAKLFWQALKFNRLKEITKVKPNFDDYLAGSCDLTGELVRKIVLLATAKKDKEAEKLKELIADIVGELIKLDLTGYLRHKYDDAKRNLKKAEEILYELRVRGR